MHSVDSDNESLEASRLKVAALRPDVVRALASWQETLETLRVVQWCGG